MNTVQNTNFHFLPNRDGNTLMKEFEGVLQHNPHTFCVGIDYDYNILEPRLDFHFTGVISLNFEFNDCGYVDEISIKEYNGFLVTWFECYMLHVMSRGLIVDKPRFVPREDDD